jgi:hypothetical protein
MPQTIVPTSAYILQTLRTRISWGLIQRITAQQILFPIDLYAKALERKRSERPLLGLPTVKRQAPVQVIRQLNGIRVMTT